MDGIVVVIIILIIGYIIYRTRRQRLGDIKTILPNKGGLVTKDDLYNMERKSEEDELNELLDKIAKNGMKSLSKSEKQRLHYLSTNQK